MELPDPLSAKLPFLHANGDCSVLSTYIEGELSPNLSLLPISNMDIIEWAQLKGVGLGQKERSAVLVRVSSSCHSSIEYLNSCSIEIHFRLLMKARNGSTIDNLESDVEKTPLIGL